MLIMLNDVRLAFPSLWHPKPPQSGEGKAKYGASLLLAPNHLAVKTLNDAFAKLSKEKWTDKSAVILEMLRKTDKLCLHDGATKAGYAGYPGNLFVTASSEIRPSVFDRNRAPLQESDGKPYAGCYVNASIEVWCQDNKFGKRINAQLRGVQFVRDGDAFAAGTAAADNEFQDLADQGDDTDPTA